MLPDLITTRWEAEDKPAFENEAKKVCAQCTVTMYNAKGSAETQLAQVESAIANGTDVIVLAPIDKTAAVNMVNKAHQAGVVVIAYATLIDSPNNDYFVGGDVPHIGAVQAESLLQGLHDKGLHSGNLVVINGDPADDFGWRYKAGVHSVLDKQSDFKVAAEYDAAKWDPNNAQTAMDQAITKLGKSGFVGVYAGNDQLASGVIASLKNAGIDPSTIPITGQDGSVLATQRIIAGTQYNTIYLPINVYAAKTADLAVALGTGKPVPAGIINGTSKTPSGYQVKAYLIDTQLITLKNIHDILLPKGIWSRDQICTPDYAAACTKAGI